eukprot:m51a1_g7147 putative domain containing protein (797) ;mRNA; r:319793-323796
MLCGTLDDDALDLDTRPRRWEPRAPPRRPDRPGGRPQQRPDDPLAAQRPPPHHGTRRWAERWAETPRRVCKSVTSASLPPVALGARASACHEAPAAVSAGIGALPAPAQQGRVVSVPAVLAGSASCAALTVALARLERCPEAAAGAAERDSAQRSQATFGWRRDTVAEDPDMATTLDEAPSALVTRRPYVPPQIVVSSSTSPQLSSASMDSAEATTSTIGWARSAAAGHSPRSERGSGLSDFESDGEEEGSPAADDRVLGFEEPDSDANVRFLTAAEQNAMMQQTIQRCFGPRCVPLPSQSPAPATAPAGGPAAPGATAGATASPAVPAAPTPTLTMVGSIGPDRVVRGGTLCKLVQYLTSDKYADMEYVHTFLMTHRGFMESEELMDLLMLRYQVRRPRTADLATWKKYTLTPVRFRCVNVLKMWISSRPEDFIGNPTLVNKARSFAALFERQSVTAVSINRLLDKALLRLGLGKQYNLAPPPEPMLMVETGSGLLDLHPEEVARQLCLVEHRYWTAINSHELVNCAWTKPEKQSTAPNVMALVKITNDRSNWAIGEVLSHKSPETRAVVIDRLIDIAEHCRRLGNYNSVMEVMAALQSSAVHRLRTSWELLRSEAWERYDGLKALMDSEGNWPAYRETLRAAQPPCVPYLGVFLTDITFINDGNPNLIPGTSLINFNKWRAVASVLKEVARLQGQVMNFVPIPFIQNYVSRPPAVPLSEQWDRSAALEETRSKSFHLSDKEKAARIKTSKEIFKEVAKREKKLRKAQPDDLVAPNAYQAIGRSASAFFHRPARQ